MSEEILFPKRRDDLVQTKAILQHIWDIVDEVLFYYKQNSQLLSLIEKIICCVRYIPVPLFLMFPTTENYEITHKRKF